MTKSIDTSCQKLNHEVANESSQNSENTQPKKRARGKVGGSNKKRKLVPPKTKIQKAPTEKKRKNSQSNPAKNQTAKRKKLKEVTNTVRVMVKNNSLLNDDGFEDLVIDVVDSFNDPIIPF